MNRTQAFARHAFEFQSAAVAPRVDDGRVGRRLRARIPPAGEGRERAGAAARQSGRPVRAQCFHPHRSCRQDHAGDAAGGDGPGRLYRHRHDPRRRARCRFRRGDARACAAQRQALWQSDLRHSGHRQFQFHSLVLETVARGRRRGTSHAGTGRRRPMAGRSGELLGVERQGHARRERARAGLRRSGRCRERRSGAAESAAQGSKRFHADRQAAQAARYAEQDRRQGRLWHRRACCRG